MESLLYSAWWWATAIFVGSVIFLAYAAVATSVIGIFSAFLLHLSDNRKARKIATARSKVKEKELENWQIH